MEARLAEHERRLSLLNGHLEDAAENYHETHTQLQALRAQLRVLTVVASMIAVPMIGVAIELITRK